MNKVFILGHLGSDPETRQIQGGSLTNFSIATTEHYSDKERTEWHRIVAFGKTAELCAQYLHKGSQVMVEGKIQTRSWEDKDGTKRYSTEIVANHVTFLDKKKQATAAAATQDDDDEIPF